MFSRWLDRSLATARTLKREILLLLRGRFVRDLMISDYLEKHTRWGHTRRIEL